MPRRRLNDGLIRAAGFLLVLLFGLSWSLQRPGPCQETVEGFHSQGKLTPPPSLFLTESKQVSRTAHHEAVREMATVVASMLPPAKPARKIPFPERLAVQPPPAPEGTPTSGRAPPFSSALA